MSRFMETQVTKRIEWAVVEDEDGASRFIPRDDYTDACGPILTTVRGYGVRESAPGYLDCTEWETFATLKEAEERAAEIDAEYDEDDDVAEGGGK